MHNVKTPRRLVKFKRHGSHDWRESGPKVERIKATKMSGLEEIQIDGTIRRKRTKKKVMSKRRKTNRVMKRKGKKIQ